MGRETLETYRTGAKRQSPVADCSRDCTTVSSTSQLSGPFCGLFLRLFGGSSAALPLTVRRRSTRGENRARVSVNAHSDLRRPRQQIKVLRKWHVDRLWAWTSSQSEFLPFVVIHP